MKLDKGSGMGTLCLPRTGFRVAASELRWLVRAQTICQSFNNISSYGLDEAECVAEHNTCACCWFRLVSRCTRNTSMHMKCTIVGAMLVTKVAMVHHGEGR
jgi:hypothetical protein